MANDQFENSGNNNLNNLNNSYCNIINNNVSERGREEQRQIFCYPPKCSNSGNNHNNNNDNCNDRNHNVNSCDHQSSHTFHITRICYW